MKMRKTDFAISFFVVSIFTLILIFGAILLNKGFSIQNTMSNTIFSETTSTDEVLAIAAVDPSPNATISPSPTPKPSLLPSPTEIPTPTPPPPTPSPSTSPKPTPSNTPTPSPTTTPKVSPTPSPSPKPSTTPAPTAPSSTDQTPITPNPNTKIPNSEYGIDAYYFATVIAAVITILVVGTAVIKKKQNK